MYAMFYFCSCGDIVIIESTRDSMSSELLNAVSDNIELTEVQKYGQIKWSLIKFKLHFTKNNTINGGKCTSFYFLLRISDGCEKTGLLATRTNATQAVCECNNTKCRS